MQNVYLDNAATTKTDPEVLQVMQQTSEETYGNASSLHSFGQEARNKIEQARTTLADYLGAAPQEIVFTSGGTESDNFAVEGVANALKSKGNHIISTAIEHHAITEPLEFLKKQGFEVTLVKVDKYGLVDPAGIKKAITDKTILVSVMHANNEIGTIQPIKEIARIVKDKGITFHSDAVQAFGHIPVKVDDLGVDLLSISAHKFHGPKGIGAIYIRKGTRIARFLKGGGQEKKRRSSTENTPGIVGLAKAVEIFSENSEQESARIIKLRDRLIKGIEGAIPEVFLNGHPTQRLPNNVNFSIKYIEGESMLLNLDMLGIAASTGSACTSGDLEPSHVLLAIGRSHELAHGSLRFSLSKYNTQEEIDYVIKELPGVVEKLRKMSPLYNK